MVEIASVADAGRIGGGGRAGVVRVRGASYGLRLAAHAYIIGGARCAYRVGVVRVVVARVAEARFGVDAFR